MRRPLFLLASIVLVAVIAGAATASPVQRTAASAGTCALTPASGFASCPGADLHGKDISGKNLRRADLKGADLTNARRADARGLDDPI